MQESSTSGVSVEDSGKIVEQAGALCLRHGKDGSLRILLVGSRRNGRWGVPKGHIDGDETSYAAAAREAFEEAGIKGNASRDVFGTFEYSKDSSPHRYRVSVHLLEIISISTSYPEKTVRKKQWFLIDEAIKNVSQPGLRELLSKFFDETALNGKTRRVSSQPPRRS